MWPFTSSKPAADKPTSELEKDLPDNLKEFFKKENPDHKHKELEEFTAQQNQINAVVERNKNQPYSYEFDNYKRNEDIKRVTYINCSELQKNVLTCLKNWKVTDYTFCDREMKLSASCTEIQTKALKKLHYDDCANLTQCKQIRYIVDALFVKNFGPLGDKFGDASYSRFMNDVDASFAEVWK